MPGAVIERPKMTRAMYQALKRHIMHEREKKKQEQKQDEALERMRKEQELRKKKEEENSLTLEQTKEQVNQLERSLESLKQEKHELFSELKKVLHQEDESKKKQQIREQNEMMSQQYASGIQMTGHPMFLQGAIVRQQSTKYLNPIQQQTVVPKYLNPPPNTTPTISGMKRGRSPSPPQGSVFPGYGGSNPSKYLATSYSTSSKQEQYPQQKAHSAQSTHVTYVTQSGLSYQQQPQTTPSSYPASQSGGTAKYQTSQSAFSSYPSHYAQHQKQDAQFPHGFPVQRVPAQGFLTSAHTTTSLPLQQQLEQANQKAGFSAEKFKLQQAMQGVVSQPSGVLPGQIPTSHTSQPVTVPPVTQKGSIMTGFPIRTQPSTTQSVHSSTQGAPRHTYTNQQASRFY